MALPVAGATPLTFAFGFLVRYTTTKLLAFTTAIAVVLGFYPFASTVAALTPAIVFATCVSSHAAFVELQSPRRTLSAGAKTGYVTAIAYGGLFAIYELWSKWNWDLTVVADTLVWRLYATTLVLVQVLVIFGGLGLAGGALVGVVISQLALLYRRTFKANGETGEPCDEPKSR